ncbi:MAG: TAXI family TRAP transporter solute-binding subunit [Magnetococcales bacterium]|nr:TAXI family TRAP transporter solute-binding subunit [Magnetococcales bacterium]
MKPFKRLVLVALLATLFSCSPPDQSVLERFITIGTGSMTGIYYPTGAAICRIINKDYLKHGVRCSVESTGGSIYNANALSNGDLSMGIAQADVTYKAAHGQKPFSKPLTNLRALFALHPESVTLVAMQEAKIKQLNDLRGKRVNIGDPGSGNARTATELLAACGIPLSELALEGRMKAVEMPDALRDHKLDAYFYVVGHPTANIKDISTGTPINLVPLTDPCVDRLLAKNSFFVKTTIPGGMYEGINDSVDTYGVKASLITSAELSEESAYRVVKAVFDNLDGFKALHPAFQLLTAKNMREGLSLPFHPGALRYFREQGWI